MQGPTRRLLAALGLLAAVAVTSVVGFMLIQQWSFLDALYMTVITVGQVGFGEVAPLSTAGRIFTIFIVVTGVAAAALTLAALVDFLVENNIKGAVERRRMDKKLAELRDHTIIAGLGRVGIVVAASLQDDGAPFVVIDNCEECIDTARERGWLALLGDATEEEVLRQAGIARAGSLVTALDSDAENLFVTVTGRSLNPQLFIVARSSHESSEPKLIKGGADRVITPNVIGGRRMAAMVLHPVVADYLDVVAHGEGVEFRLQEVELPERSQFAGQSIASAAVRERTGAYILAVRHPDGSVDTNPHPDTRLAPGQRLVVLGTGEQVAEFQRECNVCV